MYHACCNYHNCGQGRVVFCSLSLLYYYVLTSQVDNCDRLTKPRVSRPNFKTDEPVCPEGQLQCGDGDCIDQTLFCDGNPGDCKDGSDEVACTVEEDPNAAPKCDPSKCVIPDCFCSVDGTQVTKLNDRTLPQTRST